MEALIALAVLLQTLELLWLRRDFSADGIWSWALIREEFADFPMPIRWALAAALGDRSFPVFLALRCVAALLVPFLAPPALGGVLSFLWLNSLLVSARFRGTFNGGSDYMTLIVLFGTASAELVGRDTSWAQGFVGYVAFQCCLSYFIAGLVKIKSREWRSGRAIRDFVRTSSYDAPARLRRWVGSPSAAWAASWALMFFECCFPAALLGRSVCAAFIVAAWVFHLANVYSFGLNRFLFAWAAAYPALYWCAGRFGFTG
jgi:hypothetical protein